MEFLLDWDIATLFFINKDLANPVFDAILPLVRNKYIWLPIYISIITYVFTKYSLYKASYYILFLVTAVVITDMASSQLIKKTIQRNRPCREIGISDNIIQRARCGRAFSFTSSHATNHFGLAMILITLFGGGRKLIKWGLFSWAALISFAQVYVGVHYPLDVIGGACLGLALVRIYVSMLQPILNRLEKEPDTVLS